ncbi:MAG: hypothetical protein HC875_10515 [Anaerolineales bacterium]|nr:hypothetical protein [Anaerolineales bacterium]
MKVFDFNQNLEIDVPEENLQEAILNGNIGFEKGKQLTLIDPSGKRLEVPAEQAKEYLKAKFEVVPPSRLENEAKEELFGSRPIEAGLAGVARGLSFGLSDQLLTKTGLVEEETLREIKERNQGASIAGELASLLIPVGEASALVKGTSKAGRSIEKAVSTALAEELPGIAARRIGQQYQDGLVKAAVKRALSEGAGSAFEGAAFGAGHLVSEEALGNAEFNAESVISSVGTGALLGGTFGAALGIGEVGVKRGLDKARDSFKHAYNRAFPRSGDPAKVLSSARGRFDLIFADTAVKERILAGGGNIDDDFVKSIGEIGDASKKSIELVDKQVNLGVGGKIGLRNARKKILQDEGYLEAKEAYLESERMLSKAIGGETDDIARFLGQKSEPKPSIIKMAKQELDDAEQAFKDAEQAFKKSKNIAGKPKKIPEIDDELSKVQGELKAVQKQIKQNQKELKDLYSKAEPYDGDDALFENHFLEVEASEARLKNLKSLEENIKTDLIKAKKGKTIQPVDDAQFPYNVKSYDLLSEPDDLLINLEVAKKDLERAKRNLEKAKQAKPKQAPIDLEAWPFSINKLDLAKKLDDPNFQTKVNSYFQHAAELNDATNRAYAVLKAPKELDPSALTELVKRNLGEAKTIREVSRLKVFLESLDEHIKSGGQVSESMLNRLGRAIDDIPEPSGQGLNQAFSSENAEIIRSLKPGLKSSYAKTRKQAYLTPNGLPTLPKIDGELKGAIEGVLVANLATEMLGTIGKVGIASLAAYKGGKFLYDNPIIAAKGLLALEKATKGTREFINKAVKGIFNNAPRIGAKALTPFASSQILTKPVKDEKLDQSFARIENDLNEVFAYGNPAEKIENNLGNLLEVAPQIASNMVQGTLRNLEYLYDRLPKASVKPDVLAGFKERLDSLKCKDLKGFMTWS